LIEARIGRGSHFFVCESGRRVDTG
jgi:hypothetical protein